MADTSQDRPPFSPAVFLDFPDPAASRTPSGEPPEELPAQGPPSEVPASPWGTLRRDPVVRLVFAGFALLLALYVLPILSAGQRTFLSYRLGSLPLLIVVVLAMQWELGRLKSQEEREFWHDLSFGFGSWLAGAILWCFVPDPGFVLNLVGDALYVLYYVGLLLAIERQPHRQHRWRPVAVERRLTWSTVVMVFVGFFLYFLLIPIYVDRAYYASSVPVSCLYLTLDVYVALRLLYLTRATHSPRWRPIYLTLTLAAAGVACVDLVDTFSQTTASWRWDSWENVFWNVPFLLLVVAARLRHHPYPEVPRRCAVKVRLEENLPGPLGQTMTFMVLLPLIHFVLDHLDLLSAHAKPYQEGLIFGWIVLMGGLGVIQYRLLEDTLDELRRERARSERAVDKVETDLRLVSERTLVAATVREVRRKFSEAFRACPDVMAISRLSDGRFLEVNPSCERMFGWDPGEWIGRNAYEMGVWPDPEDRARIVERLRQGEGPIHDMETEYHTKTGESGTALLSAKAIEIDGEDYLFTVSHDVTDTRRREATMKLSSAALESAAAAIATVDGAGRVVSWNASAERLFGLDAGKVLGRRLADLEGVGEASPAASLLAGAAGKVVEKKVTIASGHEVTVRTRTIAVGDEGEGRLVLMAPLEPLT